MAAPAAPTPPPPVTIRRITLQGGNIAITDNFIKPNYSANLTKIGGRVTGLSKLARLVDGYAKRPQVQERLTTQVAQASTRVRITCVIVHVLTPAEILPKITISARAPARCAQAL